LLINLSKNIFFLTAMLLFIISTFLPLARAEQTEATAAIASAKEQILICYQAAKDAEAAGANITASVAVLNDAGTLLLRAEFAYSVNDFDTAQNFAIQSQITLNDFVFEANALREVGILQRNIDFIINMIFPIVGIYVVVVAGFVAWHFLRKKYETGGHKNESSRV
jgi:hypothetical protein